MSGNPERPPGGAGNVYDAQFADRIANISQGGDGGGGGGSKRTGSGSRGGWGAGVGVAVVVMILLRVVLAGSRGCSDRDRPSYASMPPQTDHAMPAEEWNPEMRHGREGNADVAGVLAGLMKQNPDWQFRLSQADIVFAPGLCREIMADTEKPGSTPGKRIYASLNALGKGLVRNLAGAREAGQEDAAALAEHLDGVLGRVDFYDVATFRAVLRPELEPHMAALWGGLQPPANEAEARELNRRALEAAYPLHIVSCDLRGEPDVLLPREPNVRLREQLKAEHEEALRKKGR